MAVGIGYGVTCGAGVAGVGTGNIPGAYVRPGPGVGILSGAYVCPGAGVGTIPGTQVGYMPGA